MRTSTYGPSSSIEMEPGTTSLKVGYVAYRTAGTSILFYKCAFDSDRESIKHLIQTGNHHL